MENSHQENHKKEALVKRCPRLGSEVPFKYCMRPGEADSPCFKIMDCWWEDFDILSYLEKNLSPEMFHKLQQSKPPSKVASLVELIEQAKKNVKNESS